jgi:hypothetical protein
MRHLKILLTGLAGLALLAVVMGLLMPSSVKITRGVIVDADSAKVDRYLLEMNEWSKWMPWIDTASGVLIQQQGSSGGPGSALKWKSLDGKREGAITFKGRKPGNLLLAYDFTGMNKAEGGFRIRKISEGRTEVQWFMEYPLKWYPWERFYGIFIDSMIGAVLENGLQNLIRLMGESRPINS